MQHRRRNNVLGIMQFAVLHVEAVATLVTTVRNKHPFCAALGHIDLGGDAVSAVDYVNCSVARHSLGAREEDVAIAAVLRLVASGL